jgi:hypothetical protein
MEAPPLTRLRTLNAAARFLLELCALAAIGYWGFKTGDGAMKFVLGIGVPVLTIIVWGTFGSPGAPLRTTPLLRLALLVVIYGWAAGGLHFAGQTTLAVALACAAVLNTVLLHVLRQE